LSVYAIIALFGLFVSGMMYYLKKRHENNQRQFDDVALLDDTRH